MSSSLFEFFLNHGMTFSYCVSISVWVLPQSWDDIQLLCLHLCLSSSSIMGWHSATVSPSLFEFFLNHGMTFSYCVSISVWVLPQSWDDIQLLCLHLCLSSSSIMGWHSATVSPSLFEFFLNHGMTFCYCVFISVLVFSQSRDDIQPQNHPSIR